MSNLWRRIGELITEHGMKYTDASRHAQREERGWISPETLERLRSMWGEDSFDSGESPKGTPENPGATPGSSINHVHTKDCYDC